MYLLVYRDRGASISSRGLSSSLLASGNSALRNGDPLAVQAMFAMSCPSLEKDKCPRERFAQQLKAEYGVEIPRSLIEGVKHPDDEVIREAIARNGSSSEREMLDTVTDAAVI